jgi:hypothetical protein
LEAEIRRLEGITPDMAAGKVEDVVATSVPRMD